jgi:hypothetical protein
MIENKTKFGTFKLTITPPECSNKEVEHCDYIGEDRCDGVEKFPALELKIDLK